MGCVHRWMLVSPPELVAMPGWSRSAGEIGSAARRPVFDGGGAADEQSIRALKSALTGRAVNRNNYW